MASPHGKLRKRLRELGYTACLDFGMEVWRLDGCDPIAISDHMPKNEIDGLLGTVNRSQRKPPRPDTDVVPRAIQEAHDAREKERKQRERADAYMNRNRLLGGASRGLNMWQLDKLEAELKPLEAIIKQAGINGPHVPLEDAQREGKQAILKTPTHALRVRIESDNLVGGFEIGSETDKKVQALLTPTEFKSLFKAVRKHERKEADGHKFRIKAKKAIANEATYLQLIKTIRSLDKDGLPTSKTVIAWDTLATLTPSES